MPAESTGTFSHTEAVWEALGGKVEYRSDKTAQIHAGIGKMSYPRFWSFNVFGGIASVTSLV